MGESETSAILRDNPLIALIVALLPSEYTITDSNVITLRADEAKGSGSCIRIIVKESATLPNFATRSAFLRNGVKEASVSPNRFRRCRSMKVPQSCIPVPQAVIIEP